MLNMNTSSFRIKTAPHQLSNDFTLTWDGVTHYHTYYFMVQILPPTHMIAFREAYMKQQPTIALLKEMNRLDSG